MLFLSLNLFQMTSPEWQSAVQHAFQQYVENLVPARPRSHDEVDAGDEASIKWKYDAQYRYWPPPLGMIIISIIEVGHYLRQYHYFFLLFFEYLTHHSKGKTLTTARKLILNLPSQVAIITLSVQLLLNILCIYSLDKYKIQILKKELQEK